MKTVQFFITLNFIFLVSSIVAQKTIWFDANWHETTAKKAVFSRPAPKKRGSAFWIVDYYKNGNKEKEGFSMVENPDEKNFEGLVSYFFENGAIFQKKTFVNKKLEGLFFEYYTTGELKIHGNFENGQKEGLWKTYYKHGKIKTKGKYIGGTKVGVWKTFYKNVY